MSNNKTSGSSKKEDSFTEETLIINKSQKNKEKSNVVLSFKKKDIPNVFRIVAFILIAFVVLCAFRISPIGFDKCDDILFLFLFGRVFKYVFYVVVIYWLLCVVFSHFVIIRIFKGKFSIIYVLLLTIAVLGIFGAIKDINNNTLAFHRNSLKSFYNLFFNDFNAALKSGQLNSNLKNVWLGGFIGVVYLSAMLGIFDVTAPIFGLIISFIFYFMLISYAFTNNGWRLYVLFYKKIIIARHQRQITLQEKKDTHLERNFKAVKEHKKQIKMDKRSLQKNSSQTNKASKGQAETESLTKTKTFSFFRKKNQSLHNPERINIYKDGQEIANTKDQISRTELIRQHKANYEKYFNIPEYKRTYKSQKPHDKLGEEPADEYIGRDIYQKYENKSSNPKSNLSKTQEKRISSFQKEFIDVNPYGLSDEQRKKYYRKPPEETDELNVKKVASCDIDNTSRYLNLDEIQGHQEGDKKK